MKHIIEYEYGDQLLIIKDSYWQIDTELGTDLRLRNDESGMTLTVYNKDKKPVYWTDDATQAHIIEDDYCLILIRDEAYIRLTVEESKYYNKLINFLKEGIDNECKSR